MSSLTICVNILLKPELIYTKALELNSNLLHAYSLLISMNTAEGKTDNRLIEKALKICPESMGIRSTYMWKLLPRWSGSHEEMKSFAAESLKYVDKNPKLKLLQSHVLWDIGSLHDDSIPDEEEYFNAALASYLKNPFVLSLQFLGSFQKLNDYLIDVDNKYKAMEQQNMKEEGRYLYPCDEIRGLCKTLLLQSKMFLLFKGI